MSQAKLWMVLPAYNEEANLVPLLNNLETVFAQLVERGHERAYVIVDDGSRDATPRILAEQAARLPIDIITHSPNQGLGFTIRDGLRRAADHAAPTDIIFAMDADNTHPSELLLTMTERIAAGDDLVIASRYRKGAEVVGLHWFRRFMSWGARMLFQTVFPIPGVRDYTCGYRAYRAGLLQEAFRRYGDRFIEYQGFHSMADILLKLSFLRPTISEVPMVLRYDLKQGDTKMRVGRTVLATLKLLLRRRFVRVPMAD